MSHESKYTSRPKLIGETIRLIIGCFISRWLKSFMAACLCFLIEVLLALGCTILGSFFGWFANSMFVPPPPPPNGTVLLLCKNSNSKLVIMFRSDYDWIDDMSITEMECVQGAFRSKNPNALFLLRNPSFLQTLPDGVKMKFTDEIAVGSYKGTHTSY